MRLLILFILLIFSSTVNAEYLGFDVDTKSFYNIESVSIVSGVYVKHISSTTFKDRDTGITRDYNETNNYWGIKLNTESGYEFSLARFNNSYYTESYSLGVHKDLYKVNNYVSLGAELLISSGYDEYQDHLDTYIMTAPSIYVGIDLNEFSGKLSLIGGTVLAASVEYRFYTR
jgi:hypothetical protein